MKCWISVFFLCFSSMIFGSSLFKELSIQEGVQNIFMQNKTCQERLIALATVLHAYVDDKNALDKASVDELGALIKDLIDNIGGRSLGLSSISQWKESDHLILAHFTHDVLRLKLGTLNKKFLTSVFNILTGWNNIDCRTYLRRNQINKSSYYYGVEFEKFKKAEEKVKEEEIIHSHDVHDVHYGKIISIEICVHGSYLIVKDDREGTLFVLSESTNRDQLADLFKIYPNKLFKEDFVGDRLCFCLTNEKQIFIHDKKYDQVKVFFKERKKEKKIEGKYAEFANLL